MHQYEFNKPCLGLFKCTVFEALGNFIFMKKPGCQDRKNKQGKDAQETSIIDRRIFNVNSSE